MIWPPSHRLMPDGRSRCGRRDVSFSEVVTCKTCNKTAAKSARKIHRSAPDGDSVCRRAKGTNLIDTWDGVDCQACIIVRDAAPKKDVRPNRRREGTRARTYALRDKWPFRFVQPHFEQMPVTRAECIDGPRPCPWASCEHHLYCDVKGKGAIRINWPDVDVAEMPESCALDVADRGGATLETVGRLMNLTRERVRQIQTSALAKAMPELRDAYEVVDRVELSECVFTPGFKVAS